MLSQLGLSPPLLPLWSPPLIHRLVKDVVFHLFSELVLSFVTFLFEISTPIHTSSFCSCAEPHYFGWPSRRSSADSAYGTLLLGFPATLFSASPQSTKCVDLVLRGSHGKQLLLTQ